MNSKEKNLFCYIVCLLCELAHKLVKKGDYTSFNMDVSSYVIYELQQEKKSPLSAYTQNSFRREEYPMLFS